MQLGVLEEGKVEDRSDADRSDEDVAELNAVAPYSKFQKDRRQEKAPTGSKDRPIDRSRIKCFRCGRFGHIAAECPKKGAAEQSN